MFNVETDKFRYHWSSLETELVEKDKDVANTSESGISKLATIALCLGIVGLTPLALLFAIPVFIWCARHKQNVGLKRVIVGLLIGVSLDVGIFMMARSKEDRVVSNRISENLDLAEQQLDGGNAVVAFGSLQDAEKLIADAPADQRSRLAPKFEQQISELKTDLRPLLRKGLTSQVANLCSHAEQQDWRKVLQTEKSLRDYFVWLQHLDDDSYKSLIGPTQELDELALEALRVNFDWRGDDMKYESSIKGAIEDHLIAEGFDPDFGAHGQQQPFHLTLVAEFSQEKIGKYQGGGDQVKVTGGIKIAAPDSPDALIWESGELTGSDPFIVKVAIVGQIEDPTPMANDQIRTAIREYDWRSISGHIEMERYQPLIDQLRQAAEQIDNE